MENTEGHDASTYPPLLEAGQLLTRLFGLVASLIGHYSIFLTTSSVLWEREGGGREGGEGGREGGREGEREEREGGREGGRR